MATNDKLKTGEKVPDKKLNRLLIQQKLEAALSDLKPLVGKKKFEKGIKKTSKQLNKDFSKKSLDSFRKQQESSQEHEPSQPETEIKDETNLLIEELP